MVNCTFRVRISSITDSQNTRHLEMLINTCRFLNVLPLTCWVLSPCGILAEDAQPSLGRVVMPQVNFWQPQTKLWLIWFSKISHP